jgi:hypothetical protein
MTADQIIQLTQGVLTGGGGGAVLALLNYWFNRSKTRAEIENIKADTTKKLSELTVKVPGSPVSAQGLKLPKGWMKGGDAPNDYDMGVDEQAAYDGKRSCYIRSRRPTQEFGTMMQTFRADRYRGKRLRLLGEAKSEGVEDWAGFWMRIDGSNKAVLGFDNMWNRPMKGTTGWTKYQVVLDVPDQSEAIALGIILGGSGQVWAKDLKLEVVDVSTPTTGFDLAEKAPDQPINLGFDE